MGRPLFSPFWEASKCSGNQTAQDGKVAGAVAGERFGARLGDAGSGQGAGDPFARRPGERPHFAACNRPLIIGLQNIVAALRETLGQGQARDRSAAGSGAEARWREPWPRRR